MAAEVPETGWGGERAPRPGLCCHLGWAVAVPPGTGDTGREQTGMRGADWDEAVGTGCSTQGLL